MKYNNLVILDDYENIMAKAPALNRLRNITKVTILNKPISNSDHEHLNKAEVIFLIRERTKITEEFLKLCPNLKLILQSGGHAYHIDLEAVNRRDIKVTLGRRVTKPMVVVPELVFGLLIGLMRNIHNLYSEMKKGKWPNAIGESLSGKTMGILGYGRHGKPVARLAEAFGMNVIAWNRTGKNTGTDEFGVKRYNLDDLLKISDVVSIHLKLSDESRNLINRQKLNMMKKGAILLNTSRGAIVDENALYENLKSNHLFGAGLDVFVNEPLNDSSPLKNLSNVILTPHIGWKVKDVLHEFLEIAADQLEQWLNNNLPEKELLIP